MSSPEARADTSNRFESESVAPATWRDYVGIARPDHWIKNAFILPGAALAIGFEDNTHEFTTLLRLAAAMAATCLLSSANYAINEMLDADTDRHHPVKKWRAAAMGRLSGRLVFLQWVLLSAVGLSIAGELGRKFLLVAALLLFMGIVYNVQPLRTKDRLYLDVLSESINNPLRFMLGWTVVITELLPPSSILIAYWMGGAYLMAVKRYSEYRFIDNPEDAALYRRSFQFYTEQTLLLSAIYYALTSALFLGVFLIKYRIELLLTIPFLALLFVWYLSIGMKKDSAAQKPEKLYKERKFMIYVLGVCVLFMLLLVVKLPWLYFLVDTHVIPSR